MVIIRRSSSYRINAKICFPLSSLLAEPHPFHYDSRRRRDDDRNFHGDPLHDVPHDALHDALRRLHGLHNRHGDLRLRDGRRYQYRHDD